MKLLEETYIRFLLCNDILGKPVLSADEFNVFKKTFYNENVRHIVINDLNDIKERTGNKKRAEKIYNAINTKDERGLKKLEQSGYKVLAKDDSDYPQKLIEKLGDNAPILLYTLGNSSLLNRLSTAVTGSRRISEKCKLFAGDIGKIITEEKKALISGGANGADYIATKSALANGGCAVWFSCLPYTAYNADEISLWLQSGRFCICWDYNPFAEFSGKNALRRNKYIYANSEESFVCQCNSIQSGTYSGASNCLKHRLSKVYVFNDGSEAANELMKLGAIEIIK